MQHAGPEEGHREGRNGDKDCADAQHGMWDPFKNTQTLDSEKHHTSTEAVRSQNRNKAMKYTGQLAVGYSQVTHLAKTLSSPSKTHDSDPAR